MFEYLNKRRNRKGFTVIELIVVIAVIAILVGVGLQRFTGYTEETKITKLLHDGRLLEDAVQRYYMDHGDWPRLNDEPVNDLVKRPDVIILNANGNSETFDEEVNFYKLDMEPLTKYVRIKSEAENYILQNPVGSVYTLDPKTNPFMKEYLEQPPVLDDQWSDIGPSTLIAGDMNAGYFGLVPASEFITGKELSSIIGLTAGSLIYSDTPWMKMALDGEILFVPQKPIRNGISWSQINARGAVFGTGPSENISIQGYSFKARLLKGATVNPVDNLSVPTSTHGSEWNRLMYPIHENALTGEWRYLSNVENNIPIWNHGEGSGFNGLFSNEDLMPDDLRSWTQETVIGSYGPWRLMRGQNSYISGYHYDDATWTPPQYSWRPVLVLNK